MGLPWTLETKMTFSQKKEELKMRISSVEKTDDGCVYWIEDKICYGICFKQAQNCETDGQVESLLFAMDLAEKDLDQLEKEL